MSRLIRFLIIVFLNTFLACVKPRPVAIKVLVQDSNTGQPINDATVRVFYQKSGFTKGWDDECKTDSTGACLLVLADNFQYSTLYVSHPKFRLLDGEQDKLFKAKENGELKYQLTDFNPVSFQLYQDSSSQYNHVRINAKSDFGIDTSYTTEAKDRIFFTFETQGTEIKYSIIGILDSTVYQVPEVLIEEGKSKFNKNARGTSIRINY